MGLVPESHAQEVDNTRCLLLGPLVISSYTGFLEGVAARDGNATAERTARTTDLISLYQQLGCPMEPLRVAVECLSATVVAPSTGTSIAETAESCMREAGLPVR